MAEHKLTKKVGPFPMWVWIAGAAAILYAIHLRHVNNGGGSNTAAMADPNAVNPQLDPGTIDTSGLGGLGVGTGAGSDPGTSMGAGGDGSLGATTPADNGSPDPTVTDTGGGGISPPTGVIDHIIKPRGKKPQRHRIRPPDHHDVHEHPHHRHGGKTHGGKPVGHRAGAHPNETVHAHHPSHFREPPAHERFTPHRGGVGTLTGPVTRAPARASRGGGVKGEPTRTQHKPAGPARRSRSGNRGK